jgi:hypothetical protein
LQLKNCYPYTEICSRVERAKNAENAQQLKHPRLRRNDLLFGIEIESELWPAKDAIPGRWWVPSDKAEGSLKTQYAYEWVSRPIMGRNIVNAIRDFAEEANKHPAHYTDRCATHIHVNMLEMEVQQLPVMALYTVAFDNLFFDLGQWDRSFNYHCRPLSLCRPDIEFLGRSMRNCKDTGDGLYGFRDGIGRYMGTNWASLDDHGTVEFRHFPGTHDLKTLLTWINAIACMYSAGAKDTMDRAKALVFGDVDVAGKAIFGNARWAKYPREHFRLKWDMAQEAARAYLDEYHFPVGDFDTQLRRNYVI